MRTVTEYLERKSGLIITVVGSLVVAGITASIGMLWMMQGSIASLTTAQGLILQDVAELRGDLSGTYTDAEAARDHGNLQRQLDQHGDYIRGLDGRVRELERQ